MRARFGRYPSHIGLSQGTLNNILILMKRNPVEFHPPISTADSAWKPLYVKQICGPLPRADRNVQKWYGSITYHLLYSVLVAPPPGTSETDPCTFGHPYICHSMIFALILLRFLTLGQNVSRRRRYLYEAAVLFVTPEKFGIGYHLVPLLGG